MFLETSESKNNRRQGKKPKHGVDTWKTGAKNKYKGIGFEFEPTTTCFKKKRPYAKIDTIMLFLLYSRSIAMQLSSIVMAP